MIGSDATIGEAKESCQPDGLTDEHCVPRQTLLICGAMTLAAPVDGLNRPAEDCRWHPFLPPLEIHVFSRFQLPCRDLS
jgi:hypothetical protein